MPYAPLSALRPVLLTVALAAGSAGAQGEATGTTPSLPPTSSAAVVPVSAPDAALTVTVQAGDTAYALARRAGLSVEALLALNNLTSSDLRVGQVLRLRALPLTHTVQPGETLYALARLYSVPVQALLDLNTLSPDARLAVGQVLNLPAVSATPPVVAAAPVLSAVQVQVPLPSPSAGPATGAPVPTGPAAASLPADWRGAALAMLGTPYVLGGNSRTGLDCSGFVLQVFTPLGVKLPRVSADQARAGVPVDVSDLQPGDLVFFDTTGGGQVTHVGIYLGDDQFVNANSYKGQVAVDRLRGDRYWSPRFLGARRVLGSVLAQQPRTP
ncbi:LysM peptidoglycan-binding domain-containing protein [Deinococcus hohokamensis]|uniref:LysM peptidoglycan-binding domain-containing protein n=1 Tax=Deinococcus hohokamensis TaxID=309883 RepID=A0ABV9I6P1_9DEIO